VNSLLNRETTIPTKEEDNRLIAAAQNGDIESRNELIMRHLPFIIKFAQGQVKERRFIKRDDLAHVCVLAMIHAIRKYDFVKAKGRFITYAARWMRSYITVALDQYSLYRLPLGTLQNSNSPETRRAIEYYSEMTGWSDTYNPVSNQLSPLEQAIFNEEYYDTRRNQKAL
jgi:RNA polymerase sigma factor (sigma-70 family)